MVDPCKFNFEGVRRNKGGKKLGDYDPNELSDIKKRALQLHKRLSAQSKRFAELGAEQTAEAARLSAMNDNVFLQDLGEVINLNKEKINDVEHFLANKFNLKAKALGLSPDLNYTTAGELRDTIAIARNIAQGALDEVSRLAGLKEVKRHSENIENILKSAGVTDKQVINELRIDSIEVGQIPKFRSVYNIGEAADRFNAQRFTDFTNRLEQMGVSPEGIEEIISSATNISAVMDEARMLGNSFGLDVGQVEGIGYVARVYTPDAQRFIDHIKKAQESLQTVKNAENSLGFLNTDVAKSRQTFHYIPEDDAVVAFQLGVEVDELHEIMDRGELTKFLHENVSDELLENMVDIGSISKLPMTTKEVHNYVVKKFGNQLPFKGMDDLFITDPERVAEYYVEQLENAAGKSAMARLVVREGLQNGWAVPDSIYKLRPDDFKGFRKLDAESIRKFYPDYSGDAFVWVNPYVDDTWRSVMGLSTNPSALNTFAQNVQYFGSFFNQALLINPGYPLRVLYDSFRNFGAAGGNWLRYSEGWADLLKVTRGGKGLDALDNTRKVYQSLNGDKLISERELYSQWIKQRGLEAAPLTPGTRVTVKRKSFQQMVQDPFDMGKAANYLIHYTKAFGAVDGAKAAFDMLKGKQGEIFAEFASVASFFEASSKWGLIKSLADTSRGNRVAQQVSGLLVSPPKFNNLKEIFRHVDDYFPQWGDTGDVVNFFNSALRPFSVFAMFNPPAQIRQAMRRPHEFVNYWRIKSFMQQQSGALEDEDLNDATFPEWARWASPQFLWKDKESGEWVTLLNGNWDARADAWSWIGKSEQDVAAFQGRYVGSTENQRELIEHGKPGMLSYFQEFLKEGQPLIRNLVSLATGRDVRTGREIERDPTQPRTTIFNLPYEVEYVLTAYPPIQRLKDINPGGVFGRPEFRDPKTGEIIISSQPGVFGSRRVDFDISKYRGEKRDLIVNTLRNFGFNVKIIDTARNLQYNFTQSKRLYEQTKKDVGKLRNDLTLEYLKGDEDVRNSPDFQRRLELFNDRVSQMAQLGRDTLVIADMMQERGIKPTESFENIDQQMLRIVPNRIGDDVLQNAINDLEQYLTIEELETNGNP